MNFALTDDQRMIRDAAEGFLAEASSSAAVRAAMGGADGVDAGLWQRIAREMGWCATHIAEAHGGLGLGMVELALLQEQMGRRLSCVPFFSSVCLAATALQQAASAAAQALWLPGLALSSALLVDLAESTDAWAAATSASAAAICASGGPLA